MGPGRMGHFRPILQAAGGTLGAAVTSSLSLEEAHAEIHCLQQFIAQPSNPSAALNYFGHGQAQDAMHTFPPTVPSVFFSRTMGDRPRPHYCYVHGFNVSHDGPACRVMDSDPRYTAAMKAATTPVGTGGNPNVGPPVRLLFRFPSPPMCLTCIPPTSPTKDTSKYLTTILCINDHSESALNVLCRQCLQCTSKVL